MKKLFILLTIIAIALCLAACTENKPIEADASEAPVVTDEPVITEAPTEAPTPEPTAEPAIHYNEEDTAQLLAFFEAEDAEGRKNGDKLFEGYDPADPATWESAAEGPCTAWTPDGRLKVLSVPDSGDEMIVSLSGTLKLSDMPELCELWIGSQYYLENVEINDCPKLLSLNVIGRVADTAYVHSAFPSEGFTVNCYGGGMIDVSFGGSLPEGSVSDRLDVMLIGDDHGSIMLRGYGDTHEEFVVEARALPDQGYAFVKWSDELRDYSNESVIEISGKEPPLGDGWVLQAAFAALDNYIPMYKGEAPEASEILFTVKPGESIETDLDFDGKPDTLTFKNEGATNGLYSGISYSIEVRLGAYPDGFFLLDEAEYVMSCALRVLDCDTSDNRLDILFNYLTSEGGEYVNAWRVSEVGNEIVHFSLPMAAVIETSSGSLLEAVGDFDAALGIPVRIRTEILDTQYVSARMTVTSEGFRLLTPFRFDEPDAEDFESRILLRDMDVTVLKNGAHSGTTVLHAGIGFAPYETDGHSYLDLVLEDGSIVRAELSVVGAEVYINGVHQEEYCIIHYAD